MLEFKRDEFVRLFREFARTYPQMPDGQHHLVAYENGGEHGRRNFEEIVAAHKRGEDVADLVLFKLMPYNDSPGYRNKGAWVHIAPALGDTRARQEYDARRLEEVGRGHTALGPARQRTPRQAGESLPGVFPNRPTRRGFRRG